jgi:hypothetical protein
MLTQRANLLANVLTCLLMVGSRDCQIEQDCFWGNFNSIRLRTVQCSTGAFRTVPYRLVPCRTGPYRTIPYQTVRTTLGKFFYVE